MYAREQLGSAVRVLVGQGSLQERLRQALEPLHALKPLHFDDAEQRERFERIMKTLWDRQQAGVDRLMIGDTEAVAIAREILQLHEDTLEEAARTDALVDVLDDPQPPGEGPASG